MIRRSMVLCALAVALASSASAALTFYTDSTAFNNAVLAETLSLLGFEDFESSTLAPGSITSVADPLAPGVLNGVFLTGTNPLMGMTIRTPGAGILSTASDGAFGTDTDQLGNADPTDSLDLWFSPAVLAVSFLPIYAPASGVGAEAPITINVFNASNSFLGLIVTTGGNFTNPGRFLGLVATGGDSIGRVNLDEGSITDFVGIDDISAYRGPAAVVPEPSTFGLMAAGCLLLGLLRARQRSKQS